jgi:hypothetical protein
MQQRNMSRRRWCHIRVEERLQVAFFVGLLQGYPTQLTEISSVEYSGVKWVGEQSVRGLLQFSHCGPLLLEAGSWGMGIVQEPRAMRMYAAGSRYQQMASEDCNRLRTLVCVQKWFVKCSNELYKCGINPITNPDPIYSHSNMWQYYVCVNKNTKNT